MMRWCCSIMDGRQSVWMYSEHPTRLCYYRLLLVWCILWLFERHFRGWHTTCSSRNSSSNYWQREYRERPQAWDVEHDQCGVVCIHVRCGEQTGRMHDTGIAGFVSSSKYNQLGGRRWIANIYVTSLLFTLPMIVCWSVNNSVAWAYGSTQVRQNKLRSTQRELIGTTMDYSYCRIGDMVGVWTAVDNSGWIVGEECNE